MVRPLEAVAEPLPPFVVFVSLGRSSSALTGATGVSALT
ncbi:hypothetical protein B005_4570 [Nocardiopsis alba ATCC BAA-2165]|uniref:Uncharacterized protein n=1 Tax=Nocardiopsis alba (strain ATCC BAA-2165 / BE74) TaxID=1205910 RepID=J7L374_NOCAA|nr:hypothetical protein B005_4570 [Nocardiopsis alba ATCC BAA-2165]